jgi:hypothetical protein
MHSVTSNKVTLCPSTYSLLLGKIKSDCEQSTAILQTKCFSKEFRRDNGHLPETENMILEARTI